MLNQINKACKKALDNEHHKGTQLITVELYAALKLIEHMSETADPVTLATKLKITISELKQKYPLADRANRGQWKAFINLTTIELNELYNEIEKEAQKLEKLYL